MDTSVADMFAAADVAGLATQQKTMLLGFVMMAVVATAFAIVVSTVKKARKAGA